MKYIRIYQSILYLISFCGSGHWAIAAAGVSDSFSGVLHYTVTSKETTTPLRYYSDGGHVRIETGPEGDPYLIWLTGMEDYDGVVMLSPFNRQYTIEWAPSRLRPGVQDFDNRKKPKVKMFPISDPVEVEYMGLPCLYFNIKTKGPDTEVWILRDAKPMPMQVLRLKEALYEASPTILHLCEQYNAVPVQIKRSKKRGKDIFSMVLDKVEEEMPSGNLFRIPEGYSQAMGSAAQPAGQSRGGRRGSSREEGGPPRQGRP